MYFFNPNSTQKSSLNKIKKFTKQDLNTMHDLNISQIPFTHYSPTSEIQHYRDSNGKVITIPTPGNGFVSNNDPVGQFVVEGVATAPLFNLIGKAALFGAGRMGNKWARSKVLSQAMDNNLLEPEEYLDNTYGEVTDYLFDKLHPELNRIGSKDQYKQYLHRMMPASSTSKVYYHGSNSNFLDGFNSAVKGVGSGAPETRSEMYFAEQPETVLQYVDGINTNIKDNNGFKHWNKLWWQAKEMLGNGQKGNWKSKTITKLRQEIPNKHGVFNESHGKLLSQIKSYYNAQDMSDKDFAKKIFNIDLGKESFNDWVSKNKAKFDQIWKAKQFDSGVYPVRINTTKPYTEFNQDTYYRDRGVFNPEQNDAILSNAANNEFNSNVAVVFNPKDNVNFLGSSQDQKAFKQFVSPNNREYIPTINKNPYITYPTEEYWNDKIKLARDKLYKQSMIDFNNNRELPINIKRKAVKLMDSFIDSDDYSNRLMNSYVDSNVRNIIKNNYNNDNVYGFFPAKYTNDFSFLNSNAPKGATNDIIDGLASQEGIFMNADYVNKKSNSEFYSKLLHELAHYSTKLERPALTDEERLLYALYDKTEDGLTLRTLMEYNESIAKNKSLEDILKSNGVTDLSKAEEFLNKKNRGIANRHMLEYLKDPQEKRARAVTTWLEAKKRNISTDQLVDMYTDINGNITKKAPSELRQLGVILDKENLKKYLNKFLFTTAVGKTLKYPQNNNKRQYE